MLKVSRTGGYVLLFIIALFAQSSLADQHIVGEFSQGQLEGWQEKSFSGRTEYRLVKQDGRQVLRAVSHASASGYAREIRIDLNKTPYLNWSWKIDTPLLGLQEKTRSGDDYAARIYVVLEGGIFFWNTLALNYVWSGSQPVGSSWPNAFSDHAVLLAVESGAKHAGQWRQYKRDLRQDLKNYLGVTPDFIDAVAIMTDTDNSGRDATAYYGDIWFSAD